MSEVMDRLIPIRDARKRSYPFVVLVDDDEDGGFSIVWPDLPGLTSWAETIAEVPGQVSEAIKLWFEDRDGEELVPAPTTGVPENLELAGQLQPTFLSAATVAERLGASKRQINAKAQRLGIGRIVGNSRVFTPAEVDLVRPRPTRGRPRKIDAVTV